eukprot:TRINITY_DN24213_c0_g1_i2.p3 TRINITY_DN24213_c0_g1~~TRINITY_DN24213_c0_g1_i2.p3  ORF type:complete len:140 (+),score=9.53 TRINITY_DN24213_c0_g1_i2:68-487(+)
MIRRPPRSTHCISSAASDVYKRQYQRRVHGYPNGCITIRRGFDVELNGAANRRRIWTKRVGLYFILHLYGQRRILCLRCVGCFYVNLYIFGLCRAVVVRNSISPSLNLLIVNVKNHGVGVGCSVNRNWITHKVAVLVLG